MIFTDEQLYAVAKTVKLNIDDLRAHIIFRGELVTAAIVADVMQTVEAYKAIAVTGVEFLPTESNKGF